ncbi:MAG: esterase [Rhodocyclaceae bacterium]|nr:esterase [Rhodocyclaceae bacterium]
MKTLVYLHGFRSSSQSRKARLLGDALRTLNNDWEYITPDLSFDPDIAFTQIEAIIRRCVIADLTLVGSSLGGFYALVCAEKHGCRAVLLNPSLSPFETLVGYVGAQTPLSGEGEGFDFTTDHLEMLRRHDVQQLSSLRKYLVVVEMGDELLNHEITLKRFAGATTIVVEGGNHDLASFPACIPALLHHAGLSIA